MPKLVIVHSNPEPEREECIARFWRIDRQDGSSQLSDRLQIEQNDRRRHPRDGAIERIVSATYRVIEKAGSSIPRMKLQLEGQ